nr:MAG TPA: Endonuclease [Caudoviricetes sp.]
MPGMPNKYGAFRIDTPEGRFDSQKEFRRWCELKLLQRTGEIRELKRQVDFVLVPEQREPSQTQKNGREKPGKLLERQVVYRADFVYLERQKSPEAAEAWQTVVEDAKGVKTKEYIIKRKLMLYVHGIKIREV